MTKIYRFWYQNTMMHNNKELSYKVRASLKNHYQTSIIKRICADKAMSEKMARDFFYKKKQLKAFDMMILLLRYDFLRDSVGLARLHNNCYASGNKLGEKTSKNLLAVLKNNPNLTFDDLAHLLGITNRSVEYQLGELVKMKLLRREGAKKNGKWVVL